jgi:hypothetical protein
MGAVSAMLTTAAVAAIPASRGFSSATAARAAPTVTIGGTA